MDHRPALEVRFPPANEPGEVRGMLHRPRGPTVAGLVVTHGWSGDMRNRLVRRIAETAAEIGLLALRMNFRYVDEKGRASRDLRREGDELTRLTQPYELVVIRDAGHSFESRGAKRDTFPEVWAAVDAWIRASFSSENQIVR